MLNLYEVNYVFIHGEVGYRKSHVVEASSEDTARLVFKSIMKKDFKHCKDITIDLKPNEMSATTTNNLKGDVDMTNLIVDVKTMENLEGKTVEQLKSICRLVGLNGFSRFTKAGLIDFMRRNIKTAKVPEIVTVPDSTITVDESLDEIAITNTTTNEKEMANMDNKTKVAAGKSEVAESLIRVISHSKQVGKFFSLSQANFMKRKSIKDSTAAALGIELKEGEFVVPGYITSDSKFSFICNMEGVVAVVRSGENVFQTIWTPACGPFVPKNKKAESKYQQVFPLRKFNDIPVNKSKTDASIVINVVEKNFITGTVNATTKKGENVVVNYNWNQSKYKVPQVTLNGKYPGKYIAPFYQELVCNLVAAYRAALIAERDNTPTPKVEEPVVDENINLVDLTNTTDEAEREVAITKETRKKNKKSYADIYTA